MDLVKVLKMKSKQYDKDKKEGDKADKEHQKNIEEKEKDEKKQEELEEKSGYTLLYNKIRKEMIDKGFKGFEVNRETYKIIGPFDPNKKYHEKKSRMKTKIVDNSKAIEKRKKINKFIEDEEPILQKTTSKFIDNIIKGIEEKIPQKPKKRLMSTKKIVEPVIKRSFITTTKIVEPVKKKRGRPPIPQEEKDKKKLEKAQKAKEEKERKQEEKEYAERERNRKESGRQYAEKQYKENKIEYKKLKRYMREENETGGNDKRTVNKYNDLKRRIKEYEDRYINNVV